MDSNELLRHMVSGAIAGTAVEAALYPLDTIKTRLQAARGGATVSWRHLYKGLGGNLVGVIPSCAVFFAVYEPAKRHLLPTRDADTARAHTVSGHLAAAALAGLASSMIRVPTEVVKTRMQTGQFTSASDALWHISRREGVRTGLFAGFGSFLLRDLPFDAIEFASYEQMKLTWTSIFGKGGKHGEIQQHESAVIGSVAGMLTGAVTTPLDVVKTRLMTQGGNIGKKYKGVLDCVFRTVAEEGWMALLKGISPRVTFIGIGGGVFFFSLEGAKDLLGVK